MHYTLTVVLEPGTPEEIHSRLEDALSVWNENREVEPYRDYEGGEPKDHWVLRYLRRDHPDVGFETDGEPTWADVVRAAHLAQATLKEKERQEALAEGKSWSDDDYEEDRSLQLFLEEETGRAYTMERYAPTLTEDRECRGVKSAALLKGGPEPVADENGMLAVCPDPEPHEPHLYEARVAGAEWDWWVVGGRWAGYFQAKPDADRSLLITGRRGTFNEDEVLGELACDGGPKGMLDLEARRDAARKEAEKLWDQWVEISTAHPRWKPWSFFTGKITPEDAKDVAKPYTIEDARKHFHSQAIMRAAHQHPEFRTWFMRSMLDEFPGHTRESYVQESVDKALSTYGLLTLDGQWVAPGRMGWFSSSETDEQRLAYGRYYDRYVESLPDDKVLVVVDLHI